MLFSVIMQFTSVVVVELMPSVADLKLFQDELLIPLMKAEVANCWWIFDCRKLQISVDATKSPSKVDANTKNSWRLESVKHMKIVEAFKDGEWIDFLFQIFCFGDSSQVCQEWTWWWCILFCKLIQRIEVMKKWSCREKNESFLVILQNIPRWIKVSNSILYLC